MKTFLKLILAVYAKLALLLHRPKIVGITGSVGKSSTKDAVALVLGSKFRVGTSSGNLNSDVGLPLAILGFQKPGGFKKNISSAIQWLWIIVSGFFRIFNFNYPEILVLEMGSDRPGDVKYLLSVTGKLSAAVITDIGMSHMESFKTPESLAQEKLSILKALGKDGFAILNADNPKVLSGKKLTSAHILTFGFGPEADTSAATVQFSNQAIGKPAILAQLAAVAVGECFGIDRVGALTALEEYQQPSGRLRVIPGINNSTILDDTYNAAPDSTIAALDALQQLSGRKLLAFGQMEELGELSESSHILVAKKISESQISIVFLVGPKTKVIEHELAERSFSGEVFWFADAQRAAGAIKPKLNAGDNILVKGSQAPRMEKVVKAIMRDPQLAPELLVRQSKHWQD
jgi:UDP-N-acetylmuramoyl-tripeptide--D-alanyl-D-alanine ligase